MSIYAFFLFYCDTHHIEGISATLYFTIHQRASNTQICHWFSTVDQSGLLMIVIIIILVVAKGSKQYSILFDAYAERDD